MTRDETVFILGEEVAQYNGAYKVRGVTSFTAFWSSYRALDDRLQKVCWTSLARSASSIPVSLCRSECVHGQRG